MNLETELGIHDRDTLILKLRDALQLAMALLQVEANAYSDNLHPHYSKEQRQNIAENIRNFCAKNRNLALCEEV